MNMNVAPPQLEWEYEGEKPREGEYEGETEAFFLWLAGLAQRAVRSPALRRVGLTAAVPPCAVWVMWAALPLVQRLFHWRSGRPLPEWYVAPT